MSPLNPIKKNNFDFPKSSCRVDWENNPEICETSRSLASSKNPKTSKPPSLLKIPTRPGPKEVSALLPNTSHVRERGDRETHGQEKDRQTERQGGRENRSRKTINRYLKVKRFSASPYLPYLSCLPINLSTHLPSIPHGPLSLPPTI